MPLRLYHYKACGRIIRPQDILNRNRIQVSQIEMLAESALGSALDKVTPIKLAGEFWRVAATSSLLGLVRGENGLPEVTRIHPNLLFAGGPRRVGGRYTPMEGPDMLYLASSERAANAEWKAGLQALTRARFPLLLHQLAKTG
jgi:hypothetical protein